MQTSSFYDEAGRKRQIVVGGVACALLAAAIAVAVWPRAVETVTGVRRVELTSADQLSALSGDNTTEFFGERDVIEIRVAENTTLREFLDRNRLNKPYHRQQIIAQAGSAAPQTPIAAGAVFKLRLTPTAADIPGTAKK